MGKHFVAFVERLWYLENHANSISATQLLHNFTRGANKNGWHCLTGLCILRPLWWVSFIETKPIVPDWVVRSNSQQCIFLLNCRCWRIQANLRVKGTSGLWTWTVFLWISWRGRTQLCRAKTRLSSLRIWPPTSCRDTSRNLSRPLLRLSVWPLSRPCHQEILHRRRATHSGPSWTRPLPLIHYCRACGRRALLGMWSETAGVRWSALGPRRLHALVTPPLPAR